VSTKPKPKPRTNQPAANGPVPSAEGILTLTEAAAFLRVPEEGLRKDAEAGRVPGRLVAGQWRFARATLLDWLSRPEVSSEARKKSMLAVAGSLKDDETLDAMVEEIYRRRREQPVNE
jgi:hypothetical protein